MEEKKDIQYKKKRTLVVKFERRKVFFFGKQRRKVQ